MGSTIGLGRLVSPLNCVDRTRRRVHKSTAQSNPPARYRAQRIPTSAPLPASPFMEGTPAWSMPIAVQNKITRSSALSFLPLPRGTLRYHGDCGEYGRTKRNGPEKRVPQRPSVDARNAAADRRSTRRRTVSRIDTTHAPATANRAVNARRRASD
jgi:hypothetical protein